MYYHVKFSDLLKTDNLFVKHLHKNVADSDARYHGMFLHKYDQWAPTQDTFIISLNRNTCSSARFHPIKEILTIMRESGYN